MGDFTAHYRSGLGSLVATNQFSNRARVRVQKGISTQGVVQFDVYGLDSGAPEPAPGDYLEIRCDGTEFWSGTIREAAQDQDDGDKWAVTGADPFALIARRVVDERYDSGSSGMDERDIVIAVLSRMGITTASTPIRYKAASILFSGTGTTGVTNYRVEYDNALDALKQLCITFGREMYLFRESDGAGGFVWVIYYEAKANGNAGGTGPADVVQATWTAGSQPLGFVKDLTDDWDKTSKVRVLGEGDGSSQVSASSGAGTSNDPAAALPMRAIKDSTVATTTAATLQNVFGQNRRVLVADFDDACPFVDTPLQLGYLYTVRDADGVSLGNFRVVHVEMDEEGADGWFSRITLLGSAIKALPQVSGPAGVRPAGLADVEELASQHQRYKQKTDTRPTSIYDITGALSATLVSPVTIPANDYRDVVVATGAPADFGKGEGFFAIARLNFSTFSRGAVGSHAHTMAHTHSLSNHVHAMAGHVHQENDVGGNTGGPNPANTTGPIPDVTGASSAANTGNETPSMTYGGPVFVECIWTLDSTIGTPAAPDTDDDVAFMSWVLPALKASTEYALRGYFPFAIGSASNFTPYALVLRIFNDGDAAITLAAGSSWYVVRKDLHRHNEVA